MKLKAGNTTYQIHFHHQRGQVFERQTGVEGIALTFCTIHAVPCASKDRPCNTFPMWGGTTMCSAKDTFNRKVGRKVSFGRAVSCIPDKATRAALWAAYINVEGVD